MEANQDQYFTVQLNTAGTEYDVVFADHDAYVDGVIRTPTMAPGGIEVAQHIAINGDGTFSVCTDRLETFDSLESATAVAIADAIANTSWRTTTTTRDERLARVGRK